MPETNELPSSGDRLVDWHFKQIIGPLIKGEIIIRKKKRLFDMSDKPPRKAIRGFYSPQENGPDIIYLSSSKRKHPNRQEMLKTMIHELAHHFHNETSHPAIYELEEILALKFTDDQKKYLKQFIPKKPVKLDPPAESETDDKKTKLISI